MIAPATQPLPPAAIPFATAASFCTLGPDGRLYSGRDRIPDREDTAVRICCARHTDTSTVYAITAGAVDGART